MKILMSPNAFLDKKVFSELNKAIYVISLKWYDLKRDISTNDKNNSNPID